MLDPVDLGADHRPLHRRPTSGSPAARSSRATIRSARGSPPTSQGEHADEQPTRRHPDGLAAPTGTTAAKIAAVLDQLGVEYVSGSGSAHKTPEHVLGDRHASTRPTRGRRSGSRSPGAPTRCRRSSTPRCRRRSSPARRCRCRRTSGAACGCPPTSLRWSCSTRPTPASPPPRSSPSPIRRSPSASTPTVLQVRQDHRGRQGSR